MNEQQQLKLQAWLDGELPEDQAASFVQDIASDADAQQVIAALRSVKTALAQNEPALKVPASREFYWSQIQRRIETSPAEPASAPSLLDSLLSHWRRLLVPATGLAVGLVLVGISLRQSVLVPDFTETTDTCAEMEAVTFHDQKAKMTVVWLNAKYQQDQDSANEADDFEYD